MSKFGYVRREATDQVDWGAVATQFTTILSEEAKVREQSKKEIEERSREMVETLNNAPTGDYVDGNTFIADYAADAQQVLLTQDRLLRQGIIKPREYSRVRANLNSSNSMMFKLGEAYQEAFKLKMERMNSADPATRSQMLEQWKMEQAEGLYNLKNSKALINPNSGMVSIGLWKDGKMDTDPSSFQTVPELMGNLQGTYDYFDVRSEVNTAVDDLGLIDELALELSGKEGGLDLIVTTTSQGGKYSGDAELIKEYNEWAGYTADAMMANPFHVTSILTNENLMVEVDGKKVPYTFTYEKDPKKRKANEIYLNRDNNAGGEPEFTDDQKKVVKDAIKQRLNDSVDKKIKATGSRQPFESSTNIAKGDQLKKDKVTFNKLGDIFYGTAEEVAASETYFRDLLGADRVRKQGNIIYITEGGVTKKVPLTDPQGNLMSFDDFAESAVLLTGISNIKDSVDLAGGIRTGKIESIYTDPKNKEFVIFEFEDGRKEQRKLPAGEMITDDKYTNPDSPDYIIGRTINLGSLTPSGAGAGTETIESEQEYLGRYLDKAITKENILMNADGGIETDDAYVETKLAPYIQGLGFTINNPSFKLKGKGTNFLEIKRPGAADGEQPHIFFTNQDNMQEQLDLLIDYIRSGTPVGNIAAQEAFMADFAGPRRSGEGPSGILD
tara:strand:- start:1585 stop:3591 length:2007 start_codon:yes stop_codon:yes gene_type:complete